MSSKIAGFQFEVLRRFLRRRMITVFTLCAVATDWAMFGLSVWVSAVLLAGATLIVLDVVMIAHRLRTGMFGAKLKAIEAIYHDMRPRFRDDSSTQF
jgi:hypothetical protein